MLPAGEVRVPGSLFASIALRSFCLLFAVFALILFPLSFPAHLRRQVGPSTLTFSSPVLRSRDAPKMKQIAVLGSTGSIDKSCLEDVQALSDRLAVFALTAHQNAKLLGEQAEIFSPRLADLCDRESAKDWPGKVLPTEHLVEADKVEQIASLPEVDVVVSGIVGAAGLRGTWAAVEAGKTVAIANKETLVVAGALVMEKAKQTGAMLIPVDSEHSAVFQALKSG